MSVTPAYQIMTTDGDRFAGGPRSLRSPSRPSLRLTDGSKLAPIVAASGLVYLGAAALGKPWTTWPIFALTFAVITAVRFHLIAIEPTWIFIGAALVLAGYGLLSGAARPTFSLPLQAVAMLVLGAAAAIALLVDGMIGAYLVALGLLAHAAWDVYHHIRNRVVVRSMAEFCGVLDTLLAIIIIVYVTVSG